MLPSAATLVGYLPLLIFAGVMFWRLRTIDKARPLRRRTLWYMPALLSAIVGLLLFRMPPSRLGVAALVTGIALGALIGWQRARLMRLHVEGRGKEARVMIRQSRAALLLLLALAGTRALFRSAAGAAQMSGASGSAQLSAGALITTDGLLGAALGMIVAHRIGVWRRARAMMGVQPGS